MLANLFQRKNLVGGTRRLRNLSELFLPTLQTGGADHYAGVDAGGGRWNGRNIHFPRFPPPKKTHFVCVPLLMPLKKAMLPSAI